MMYWLLDYLSYSLAVFLLFSFSVQQIVEINSVQSSLNTMYEIRKLRVVGNPKWQCWDFNFQWKHKTDKGSSKGAPK